MINLWKMLADLHWQYTAMRSLVASLKFIAERARADAIKWKMVAQSWAGDARPRGIQYTEAEFKQLDRDPALAEVKARLMKQTNVRLRYNMGQLLRTVDTMAAKKPNRVTASMLAGLAKETQRIRFETNIGVDELEVDGAMVTDKQLEDAAQDVPRKAIITADKTRGAAYIIISAAMKKIRGAFAGAP